MNKSKLLLAIVNMSWYKRIVYFLLFIVFICLLNVSLAPSNKLKEYKQMVQNDSVFIQHYDSAYNHAEIRNLVFEKFYKEALLRLSADDSIQIALSIPDSSISLHLKGVEIYKTQYVSVVTDKVLLNLQVPQLIYLFSNPLELNSQLTTIIKEPIVERKAPKNPEEAALNAWKPDTLVQNPAFCMFHLQHDINLVFEQDVNQTRKDKKERLKFYSTIRIGGIKKNLKSILSFSPVNYKPTITITLPADEIRIIYRALPVNSKFVIRLS